MAGCYTDVMQNDYFRDISPFYTLLFLLICEKLAQNWLLDRFGCDEELCKSFQRMIAIHEDYKKSKSLRKGQQKTALGAATDVTRLSLYGSLMQQEPAVIKPEKEQLSPIIEERSSLGMESMRQSSPLEDNHSSQRVDIDVLLSHERDAYLEFHRESIKSNKEASSRRSMELKASNRQVRS